MRSLRNFGVLLVRMLILSLIATTAHAVAVSGQGTWESTLQGRDLDGNAGNGFEAYYDTTLDITWLADANFAETSGLDADGSMTWANANSWAAGLNVNGITGWRLPTNTPINGSTYNTAFSNNGTADRGAATTTTDGTDGGWRSSSGNPVSEMGHMYYVTLGNLGVCTPNGSGSTTSCNTQTGFGLINTANFSNVKPSFYWSGSAINSIDAWNFFFSHGTQGGSGKGSSFYTWAVHSGDVGAVPVPAAVWLFGSGLIGLIGVARRKKTA